MTVTFTAFLVIVLFTVHEMDEIIRVCPWIAHHANDPRYARDTWISRRASYPSTEAMAMMIAEEIVIFSLVLLAAISLRSLPLVLAVAAGNAVHLVAHLEFAARVRAWNPGSVTAAITLPVNVALIVVGLAQGMNVMWWLTATLIFGGVLFVNLLILHRLAPTIQRLIW